MREKYANPQGLKAHQTFLQEDIADQEQDEGGQQEDYSRLVLSACLPSRSSAEIQHPHRIQFKI